MLCEEKKKSTSIVEMGKKQQCFRWIYRCFNIGDLFLINRLNIDVYVRKIRIFFCLYYFRIQYTKIVKQYTLYNYN
jgi:hypothetical protein